MPRKSSRRLSETIHGPVANVAFGSPSPPVVNSNISLPFGEGATLKKPVVRQPKSVQPSGTEFRGEVVRVLYANDNGWHIVKVRPDGDKSKQPVVLKGVGISKLTEGSEVSCRIEYTKGKDGATELKALSTIIAAPPKSRSGIEDYLKNHIAGVGAEMAKRLIKAFGEKTLEVIEKDPHRLLGIQGISAAKLKKIMASYKESAAERRIAELLGKYDIGPRATWKVYERFGEAAADIIQSNPYRLTEIRGIGFKTADAIALSANIAPNSPLRIRGAINHIIESEISDVGDTAIRRMNLLGRIQKLTGLGVQDTQGIVNVVSEMIANKDLAVRSRDSDPLLSANRYAAAEQNIARNVARIISSGTVRQKTSEALAKQAELCAAELGDPDQIEAVKRAFAYPLSVITGRPGCGKTTVTRYIVDTAEQSGMDGIVFCAPTGKAARRLSEATGKKARTIHSTLGYAGSGFLYNENNPLDGKLFIVDEASMIDVSLMNSFMRAVPSGARVIFVGDVDQLPSVGPGNVLHDLIASKCIPVSTLHTIHRTAAGSDIVVNAHRIIDGRSKDVDFDGQKDFRFTAVGGDLGDKSLVDQALSKYQQLVHHYGPDGVQMLASRKGTASGVNALNQAIREMVNPPAQGKDEINIHGLVFRVGDRVMQTANSAALGVSNGEIGSIVHVDAEEKVVGVDFGDRVVDFSSSESGSLDYAYAITIHKSQGSEFPAVVMVAPPSHTFMLNRNLIYTGVTRGKQHVEILGEKSVLHIAINKKGNDRVTYLASEISALLPEVSFSPVSQGSTPPPRRKMFS